MLGWSADASWLAGIAMSTTSVAVVYAVMIEFGFNVTDYGKTVLAACFITDLATVIGLGLLFAPFTLKTVGFVGVLVVAALVLPWLTPIFFKRYGGRPSEMEAKYLLLALFALGALAGWADSEAVLPAYLIGMVLAGTVGKDHVLIRRLRTLTFGLLTPFYFLRAGAFVSVPALIAAPGAFPGALPELRWRAEDHCRHPGAAGHREDPHAPGPAGPCAAALTCAWAGATGGLTLNDRSRS